MCVILETIVFIVSMYLNFYSESVHTCIILVSMCLHCYSEFNVSPYISVFLTVYHERFACRLQNLKGPDGLVCATPLCGRYLTR